MKWSKSLTNWFKMLPDWYKRAHIPLQRETSRDEIAECMQLTGVTKKTRIFQHCWRASNTLELAHAKYVDFCMISGKYVQCPKCQKPHNCGGQHNNHVLAQGNSCNVTLNKCVHVKKCAIIDTAFHSRRICSREYKRPCLWMSKQKQSENRQWSSS